MSWKIRTTFIITHSNYCPIVHFCLREEGEEDGREYYSIEFTCYHWGSSVFLHSDDERHTVVILKTFYIHWRYQRLLLFSTPRFLFFWEQKHMREFSSRFFYLVAILHRLLGEISNVDFIVHFYDMLILQGVRSFFFFLFSLVGSIMRFFYSYSWSTLLRIFFFISFLFKNILHVQLTLWSRDVVWMGGGRK